jgi:hypothetical protein
VTAKKQLTYSKQCLSVRAFANELYVYRSAFPYKVDLIEVQKPHTLVLERLDGIPYLDVPIVTDHMIAKLAKTISRFHSVTYVDVKVLCHWDNQPRNILWNEQKQRFYLLDFEDIKLAAPEADLAHLFLFWAEVMSLDDFTSSVNTFLQHYKASVQLKQTRWKQELLKAKRRFDRRRKKHNKKEPVVNDDRLQNRLYLTKLTVSI